MNIIHNKNGWTRLYPPVEDESVERIEIEVTNWTHNGCEGRFCTYSFDAIDAEEIGLNLSVDQPEKMILEIPKEKE